MIRTITEYRDELDPDVNHQVNEDYITLTFNNLLESIQSQYLLDRLEGIDRAMIRLAEHNDGQLWDVTVDLLGQWIMSEIRLAEEDINEYEIGLVESFFEESIDDPRIRMNLDVWQLQRILDLLSWMCQIHEDDNIGDIHTLEEVLEAIEYEIEGLDEEDMFHMDRDDVANALQELREEHPSRVEVIDMIESQTPVESNSAREWAQSIDYMMGELSLISSENPNDLELSSAIQDIEELLHEWIDMIRGRNDYVRERLTEAYDRLEAYLRTDED